MPNMQFHLNTNFFGDKSLSQRITDLDFEDDIIQAIQDNILAGASLSNLVNHLSDYTTNEDLPQYIRSIAVQARQVMNDELEYPDFVQTLMDVKADLLDFIDKSEDKDLESFGMSTELQEAYLKVVNAAENLNDAGLTDAIENAINQKALSNAFRIATTETNRVYNQTVYENAHDDEDVVAFRLQLSQGPNNCDECYDLSLDFYDVDSVPMTPVHPRCRCHIVPVYILPEGIDESDIVDDYDGDVMESYD
jgi:SPP1 gp7 family putative phage head morphogenesis protein